MNNPLLTASRLYGIVDSSAPISPVALARLMLAAGVRILQLRLKDAPVRDFLSAAREVAALCRLAQATLIVNDRADIAILADAPGVHLGQDDLPLTAARRLLGPGRLIGISTHTLVQARAAEAGGADYIGLGPIFAGGTKRNREGLGLGAIHEVRAAVSIPIVAIGGITEATAASVVEAGADAVAIISDILAAPDIEAKCRSILTRLAEVTRRPSA